MDGGLPNLEDNQSMPVTLFESAEQILPVSVENLLPLFSSQVPRGCCLNRPCCPYLTDLPPALSNTAWQEGYHYLHNQRQVGGTVQVGAMRRRCPNVSSYINGTNHDRFIKILNLANQILMTAVIGDVV